MNTMEVFGFRKTEIIGILALFFGLLPFDVGKEFLFSLKCEGKRKQKKKSMRRRPFNMASVKP